ncbi:hypothetical protein BC937DRAFT_95567 [Endogone sp. FLAS-F59071]|nr:hypothetical protein BC937DRAFT_95567 [Endogone sp. FLAS-F59071]|eukprot:RUS20275.1 hypothetical protein BC937DRAFT_95567 [Endogone sp. FLAS-F59071]
MDPWPVAENESCDEVESGKSKDDSNQAFGAIKGGGERRGVDGGVFFTADHSFGVTLIGGVEL